MYSRKKSKYTSTPTFTSLDSHLQWLGNNNNIENHLRKKPDLLKYSIVVAVVIATLCKNDFCASNFCRYLRQTYGIILSSFLLNKVIKSLLAEGIIRKYNCLQEKGRPKHMFQLGNISHNYVVQFSNYWENFLQMRSNLPNRNNSTNKCFSDLSKEISQKGSIEYCFAKLQLSQRWQTKRLYSIIYEIWVDEISRSKVQTIQHLVEDAAIFKVIQSLILENLIPYVQPRNNPGYDILGRKIELSHQKMSTEIFIEVKSSKSDVKTIRLSDTQFEKAKEAGGNYWVYVVEYSLDPINSKIYKIQNFAAKFNGPISTRNWKRYSIES